MKKTIAVVLSLLLCFSLVACGGDTSKEGSEKSSSSVVSENSDDKTSEASVPESSEPEATPEPTPEPSPEPTPESTPESTAEADGTKSSNPLETEYIVKELDHATFEVRSGFEYIVNGGTIVINLETDVAMMTVSEHETSATEKTEDVLNAVFVKAMLDTYDDFQNETEYDLELGGKTAKSVIAQVYTMGNWYNCAVASAVNDGNQYVIVFIDRSTELDFMNEFQHLVESFTFT